MKIFLKLKFLSYQIIKIHFIFELSSREIKDKFSIINLRIVST